MAGFYSATQRHNAAAPLAYFLTGAYSSVGLLPIRVLDTIDEFEEEVVDGAGAKVDREFWRANCPEASIGAVDKIVDLLKTKQIVVTASYTTQYIALSTTGSNFCLFRLNRRATRFAMYLRVPNNRDEVKEKLAAKNFDAVLDGTQSVRVMVRPEDVDLHASVLLEVLIGAEAQSR